MILASSSTPCFIFSANITRQLVPYTDKLIHDRALELEPRTKFRNGDKVHSNFVLHNYSYLETWSPVKYIYFCLFTIACINGMYGARTRKYNLSRKKQSGNVNSHEQKITLLEKFNSKG